MQRTADALSPTDAVAAINAYAYQNAVDLIAPASVTTGPLNAKDEPVAKTTDASASAVVSPLASRKKVVFITSAATSSSLGEEKQPHEARCVESTCANCAVL
ncbi:hypothetical protein JKF63_07197 [Porcisia hertigi]|uniref:Uncharacterized protein n=1 Tax=Porcisia hertigi TaxID=2761500 RepID=A0A836LKI0_9TRYP|nr:hypothetical protein JKF63_07197 [Porcisia hertigi]